MRICICGVNDYCFVHGKLSDCDHVLILLRVRIVTETAVHAIQIAGRTVRQILSHPSAAEISALPSAADPHSRDGSFTSETVRVNLLAQAAMRAAFANLMAKLEPTHCVNC